MLDTRDEATTAYERLTIERDRAPHDLGFEHLTGYELTTGVTITRDEYHRRCS